MTFKPSLYQQNVYNFINNSKGSAVVQAVAGSGKTTTIINALNHIPSSKNVLLLAFNKSIAEELKTKVPENVRVVTYHSCAFSAYRYQQKSVKVDNGKLTRIIKDMLPEDKYQYFGLIKRLVSLAKAHAVGYLTEGTRSDWIDLIDKFDLISSRVDSDFDINELIHYSVLTYKENNLIKKVIDFDDMILFPLIHNSSFFKQDYVFVDEAQDTSSVQRALLKRMLKRNGRIIAVGDSAQAIYGFRGADSDSMSKIISDFNAKELPLSICYRCSKEVIKEAQKWHPKILPFDKSPEGSVTHMASYEPRDFKSTDAIICRNTAPLISMAFSLIARDIPVNILGRDIGKGLVSYINSLQCDTIASLSREVEKDYQKALKKFESDENSSKVESLSDRKEVINIFIRNSIDDQVDTLCSFIENFFGVEKNRHLTLCTAHKSKGLEWDRVFILNSECFMPKWVKQDWAIQQEKNIVYVAITRAKKDLVYIKEKCWK
jgi:superfamily I DNA/RNA helicase